MENKKEQSQKKLFIILGIVGLLITGIGVTYSFIDLTVQGSKRQVIKAGTLSLALYEHNEINIAGALPMYDEVGMIQNEAFTFDLVNNSAIDATYTIKLVEVGTSTLSKSDVKYGLTKDGVNKIGLLSDLENGVIDSGTIAGNRTTISYALRFWIRNDLEDETLINGKNLTYKIDVEVGMEEAEEIQKVTAYQQIQRLAQPYSSTFPDFNNISSETNGRGVYTYREDGKDIYYWRGNVAATENSDNNVIFAGYCWQMVRTTKTGGIKMIYNGEVVAPILDENNKVIGGKCTNTEEDTQLSGAADFNVDYDDNAYVGYMYGLTGLTAELTTPQCIKLNSEGTAAESGTETTEQACTEAGGKWATTAYEATHANVVSSTIKNEIDTWFSTSNLNTPENLEKIEDTVYCNDRSIDTISNYGTGLGYGKEQTAYMARYRLYSSTNKTPSLECTNQNDRFTVNDTVNGNGALAYPVGLLTADEISLAGGVSSEINSDYYLYTGQNYWSLTPYIFTGSYTGAFVVNNNDIDDTIWARPVISLVTGTKFADNGAIGTKENPYVVE